MLVGIRMRKEERNTEIYPDSDTSGRLIDYTLALLQAFTSVISRKRRTTGTIQTLRQSPVALKDDSAHSSIKGRSKIFHCSGCTIFVASVHCRHAKRKKLG
jgi:hypothetical protein